MENKLFYSARISSWDCDDGNGRNHRIENLKTNIDNPKLLNHIEAEAIQQAYNSDRPINYTVELDKFGNELKRSF